MLVMNALCLLDYSTTQLQQAQARLGGSDRYIFVAADVYRLPFVDGLFDGATMIRTLHHMADAPKALAQIRKVLQPGSTFILEFASKFNIKAILRYFLRKQTWSPFSREPVEFVELNFDFHPKAVRNWLQEIGFHIEKTLTVSHFRLGLLKKLFPTGILVALDSLAQWTGSLWQLTPSVFVKQAWAGREADQSQMKCSTGSNVQDVRYSSIGITKRLPSMSPRVAASGLSVMGFTISGSRLANKDVQGKCTQRIYSAGCSGGNFYHFPISLQQSGCSV